MKANTPMIGEEVKVDPIALIGIGCRFPGGAHNPESFWELLREGSDAIVDVPPERWNLQRFYDPDPNKPGKMYTRQGGFLQQRIDEFDALFFGIAPREAECMDPQQRLLLETSWEALEDAGIPHDSLAGSNTGVFIGAFTLDHKLTQMGKMNRDLIGAHTAIGSTMTILSNRISYILDLRGPSISLDTACSSSLVALHLACQSIWRGECNLAMAGGVNVMMRPEYPVAMCKGGFLAPDGRSKSFDIKANGYGRGEGAGVVVLKPLSAALRDGDSIYALVRGTGANQDGRTNGITVPNPESQTALIRNVCERYGVDIHEIHYFEAHGTGTPVGDPLEAQALGTVVGQRPQTEEICMVGSVKAAIGHLEAAAGVAGFIKTALCMFHRQVPPQANLDTPNPYIPFDELGLRLPRKLEPLAAGKERVYAGVNSFGYGGTNAHVILENAPTLDFGSEEIDNKMYLLPLSARSEAALTDLAKAWLERFTEDKAPSLKNLCYSAACRRGHHNYRMAVAGESLNAVREQLQTFVEQGAGEWLSAAKISQPAGKPVFVYTGMGPQWWAMGRELYHADPVYRKAVDECDAIFRRLSGWSILEEMLADKEQSRMTDTEIAQPANFLIQVGLTAAWRSLGIEPAAIVGHSVGEVSAAYASGVLTLEDAVKVSYHRSRIQKKAAGLGKMLAVGISPEQCAELLALTDDGVSIAAVNSPSSVTLAGDAHSLEAIATYLTALGEFNRFLQVEVAYHSPFMEPLKPEVREVLADLQPSLPKLPLYSTCTGDLVNAIAYDAEYWCNNIREPVYFAKAMESLLRDGHRVFLEIGPHPVLSTAIKECCRKQNIQPQTFASLRRERPECRTLNLALAGLYTAGCEIDWPKLYAPDSCYIKLPTYPWQRETYWREAEESIADRIGTPLHPLLDRRLPNPRPSWQSAVNRQFIPYLDDHCVDGLVVMPGAVYVEAGLAALAQLTGAESCILENLRFHQALVLDAQGGEAVMHVSLDRESGEYGFFSREHGDHLNWRLHASGKSGLASEVQHAGVNIKEIEERCQEKINVNQLYIDLGRRGLLYGPYFRTVCQLQRCHGEVLAKIELHDALVEDASAYRLHPSLLDGCFQSLMAALEDNDNFYMPVSIKRIAYHQAPGQAFSCHGKLNRVNEQGMEGDLSLFDEEGRILVEVQGLRCRALASHKDNPAEQLANWTYMWRWSPKALQPTNLPIGTWLVFNDAGGIGESLCRELEVGKANKLIRVPAKEIYRHESGSMRPLNEGERSRLHKILQQAKASGCVGVVYLWGLDAAATNDPVGITQASIALQIIQMLGEVFDAQALRLYMITQGAQPVMDIDGMQNMAQTPLVGLARVAFNEYPTLRCSLMDLDVVHSNAQTELLKLELLADDVEDDVALRGGERYVHRLERFAMAGDSAAIKTQKPLNGEEVEAFYLKKEGYPIFAAMPRPQPKIGEVLVALDCINMTGVNWDNDKAWDSFKGYFATGVICGMSNEVTAWPLGETVIIAAEGMPASHVSCPVHRVFSAANFNTLSHEEIAALMTTAVPAYHALSHVARVAPGETVLIDADSGAIAFAVDSVGRWLNARPLLYSTNDARLLVLETLDGESAIDTRKPDFSEFLMVEGKTSTVRAWIRGAKTNQPLVTNPLPALGIHEIVIGKADFDENPPRSLEGGSFSHVDALNLAFNSPDIFSRLLAEISKFLNSGQKPLSAIQTLTPEQSLAGLSSSNGCAATHTQVLSIQNKLSVPVSAEPVAQPLFDADAAYMITGGFGGFGLETAKWMVKNGVKSLILVGRRGAFDDASKAVVKALEDSGVQVMAAAADISDAVQVEKLLTRVVAECPPLKGVLHAAAVLDDAAIAELNAERMAAVMQAKALGAWHLHNLTQNQPLDFFVLFSSVSALIGNARQANYAAANTFLDALAWRRKTMGLPAASINWGAIATGMAAGSEEVKKHLELMGMYPLTAVQALEAWAGMRDKGLPQYGLMNCNWSRWQEFEPAGGNSPRFSKLMDSSADGQDSLLSGVCLKISQLPEQERAAAMGSALAEQVAKTLRLPTGKIDMQQSLTQMGVDSLMAAELQTAIHHTFGVRVSTLKLMRGQNLAHLAEMLMESTHLSAACGAGDVQTYETSLVDRLSGEDVDILLNQLLMEEGK